MKIIFSLILALLLPVWASAQVAIQPLDPPRAVTCTTGIPVVCRDQLTGQVISPDMHPAPMPESKPGPVYWQEPPLATTPSPRARLDMVLGLTGLSAASIALGLTMSCTSDGTCREVNPVMARWIGEGPVKSTVSKAALNSAAYYVAWRVTHSRPKVRTAFLAVLTAINVWDAAHDIRQMREIESRR